MSIPIDTYCLQCLLRRNIALAQTLGTEEQAMAFAKEIMKLCIAAPEGVSSPLVRAPDRRPASRNVRP